MGDFGRLLFFGSENCMDIQTGEAIGQERPAMGLSYAGVYGTLQRWAPGARGPATRRIKMTLSFSTALDSLIGAVPSLIGVIVGALATTLRERWADSSKQDRHARYLAIRVVCILDKYVEKCAEVVLDDGRCEGQRNEEDCLEPQVAIPPPPEFPTDVDWKSIEPRLMYRLLSLPNEADAANRRIAAASQFAFPPDYDELFEERNDQYSKLGLAANALKTEIRKQFDIPSLELDPNIWNPIEALKRARSALEERRRKRAEAG